VAQEESKKLRQKQRDKTKPKMGKLDIDYQVGITSSAASLFSSTLHAMRCTFMHAWRDRSC
jgi:hypothetical protein